MVTPDDQPTDDSPPPPTRESRGELGWTRFWEWAKEALFILILLAILIALGVVVFRVITTDTSLNLIPTSSESAAVIRANERVVQLTQWTISTILIVAGGLIGLNWYQNQRRYERDKAEIDIFRQETSREVGGIRDSVSGRLDRLEQQSAILAEQHRDHVLIQAVDDVARAFSVNHAFQVIVSWYDRIREIDSADQERALTLVWQGFEVVNELLEMGEEPAFFIDRSERNAFYGFLDRVEAHYPEMHEFLTTYRTIAQSWEETLGMNS